MKSRTLPTWLAASLFALTLGVSGVLGGWLPLRAQEITDSLDEVGEETGLGSEDPRIIVANIINVSLTVLGVIVVVLIIYGGFVWMTASGSPERVEKAKKILINSTIGLAIILASWGITSLVINSLLSATDSSSSSDSDSSSGGGGLGGGGSSSAFTVTDYSPEGEVSIRNIELRVTFSSAVEESTVAGNITITNASTGEEVEGTLEVASNKVTFVPTAACPDPNTDRYCFDENTTFTVTVGDDIESSGGKSLTCTSDAGCSSSFTSGSVVDTEDPTAEFTYPDDGDGVPSGSSTTLQVTASDDTQVSGADFSLDGETFTTTSAPDNAGTDVVIESEWDTADLVDGERYKVTATVTDIAGNETTDSVMVVARPASCFNGELDADLGEEDVDCGGDSSSADYCGACDGSSCSEDADCSSGSCEDGVCVENPEIADVSPGDGAVGTYVTVSGSGFGSREGVVAFTSADGASTVEAEVLSCGDGDGWSDDEIIVAVPEGAGDGPVTVTTSKGATDSTEDDDGELVPNFDVNDTERPGLCTLSDTDGAPNAATKLEGENFGDDQGESTVQFDGTEAGSYSSWSSTEVAVTVPRIDDGDYDVTVTVDGNMSNSLEYSVADDAGAAPTITEISPSEGGIGQYVTITGSNFGTSTGSVIFENDETGVTAYGSIDFPDQCSDDVWGDEEIIIIVPEEFTDESALSEGDYTVYVRDQDGDESNATAFTVTDALPTPGICALSPDTAGEGEAIVVYGDNFGTTGSVTFYSEVVGTATAWDSEEISVTVPSGAASGPFVVTVNDEESNAVTFTVGDSDASSTAALAAEYAWSFSTGQIPETPEIVESCDDTTVSAVPNSAFTDDGDVCVNAVVYAEFTAEMNSASVEDAVTVEVCTGSGDEACDETSEVDGTTTVSENAMAFTWVPDADFDVSSTYRVTVDTTARSSDDVALDEDVTWEFTTSSSSDPCVIDRVVVSPSLETITEINATASFEANPVTGCVITDSSDYAWDWGLDTYSYADFNGDDADCDGDPTACASIEALAEGEVVVTAAPAGYVLTGEADLIVNFSDPYVTDYQPNCTEACVNADVGATFNTAMTEDEVADQEYISLYRCENELCTDLTLVESAVPACVYASDDSGECTGFTFGDLTLTAAEFYRVVISGSITSTSGVGLIRTNYGTDFSWTFRVREDETLCAVERIEVSPDDVNLTAVGEQAAFSALAYGEADSCSTSGQQLSSADFNWAWVDPIADNPDNDASYSVAEWYLSGQVDADVTSIPAGCTSLCLAAGSEPEQAVCGNNELEQDEDSGAYEDCDDGNALDGDGCSSSCKYEGTDPATFVCSDGVTSCLGLDDAVTCGESSSCGVLTSGCGDSVIDAYEDCDDGDTTDGDGCSATCTAEGSSSVGATCGNNDIAYDTTTLAGEECDDGNAVSGDGCSRECVREGSSTEAQLGTALCGDGTTTEPYETCDDGNTLDDDGCSSTCLREGSYVDATLGASDCGNGEVEYDETTYAGEACEPSVDGEGCGENCLWKGASTSYETPSFCGDGTVGTGELTACENGATGDGNIDATQVAEISKDAAFEVSTTTNLAVAEIEVAESSSGLSTTAELTLSCVAESDQDCADPTTYGVGDANCCYERPEVELYPTGAEVCRNSAIYGEFTQQMDVSSFTSQTTAEDGTVTESIRMYARLDMTTTTQCPSSHTTLSRAPSSLALRVWNAVNHFIFGKPAQADSGDCVVPVSSYTQVAQSDGTYKVAITYDELLEADATYELVIEGDDDTSDEATEGVLSTYGVGMNGTQTQTFTTGSEICTLDDLIITDTDTESPYFFTQTEEEHTFAVTPVSYASGSAQEITPITGSYDWSYGDWSSADETLFTTDAGASDDEGTVTAVGENGDTSVSITATMTDDVYYDTACDSGEEGCEADSVSGTASVEAYLCENPWPTISAFPWSDDATGEANGLAEEGDGYTNFSTGYCRDVGDDADLDEDGENDEDLPTVTVVRPPTSLADNVFKEYLFEVADDSGDAIGVRIISDVDYLSPMAWYEAQGFVGSPTETTVDGFPAVEDGRTVYILAPNAPGTGSLYPQIFAISYNEGASDSTIDIYTMMLEHLEFAINLPDDRYCYESGAIVVDSNGDSVTCESDLECDMTSSQECGSDKLKITRDITRLADLKDVGLALSAYGEANGACSDTTSQSCTSDDDCPGDETCDPVVPTLPAGTFVSALASSAWDSWNAMLGGALNETLPTDPLNDYSLCGSTGYESYDAATCVNQTNGEYVCPANSYIYHYRAIGAESYELAAQLEYDDGTWYYDVDDDTTDGYAYTVETAASSSAFCDGSTFGTSTSCGDGVIGGSEVCEIGDEGDAKACDLDETSDSSGDGDATNDADGLMNQVCQSDCLGYEDSATATCEAYSCGNGVVEGTEACDDGAQNGTYGYCGTDCTYESGSSCGDGEVSGAEACDCGNSTLQALAASGDAAAQATLDAARPYGGASGSCAGINGDYAANVNTTCAWDCSGAASYCGDDTVDTSEGEYCDGDSEDWEGALCGDGVTACTTDADCTDGSVCGAVHGACPVARICDGGTYDGYYCDVTEWPDSVTSAFSSSYLAGIELYMRALCSSGGGTCDASSSEYQTYRTRSCSDDTASCDWTSWTYCNASDQLCGNGTVDGSEECDDGNSDSTDSCTNSCTANVCGDGYLYEGEEECDEGASNGDACDASYGSSCSACSATCQYVASTGEFCGDGEINGDEFCDGTDVPYMWYDENYAIEGYPDGDGVLEVCDDSQVGTDYSDVYGTMYSFTDENGDDDTSDPTCTAVGVCDGGGDENGMNCVEDSECASGSCIFPTCENDCASACPFTYETATLTLTSNLAGADPEGEVTLVSYDSDSTTIEEFGNSATVTIPSCTTASGLIADVDYDVEISDLYVVFVTDTSGSMSAKLGSSKRMGVAKEVLADAVSALFDELGSKAHIELIQYDSTVTYDTYTFWEEEQEADLLELISDYTANYGTATSSAMTAATLALGDVEDEATTTNVRKAVVLLSDGAPDSETATDTAVGQFLNNEDFELYSIALTTTSSLITDMNRWSSNSTADSSYNLEENDYNPSNLIDYSYDGSTADELEDAYQAIVDSLTQATATFISSDGSTTYTSSSTLSEGSNVSLPWPTAFACDEDAETEVPLQITFSGEGEVTLSNVRVDYCAP